MKNIIYILLFCLSFTLVEAQTSEQDSVVYESDSVLFTGDISYLSRSDSAWHPNPRKATLLSAALPGAGQIYNQQWWKVPIIYAALGTAGYFVYYNNHYYIKYRDAYVDYTDNDPTTDSYYGVISESYVIDESNFATALDNNKDYFRRNRDLVIFSMIGIYVLNILEANVAAHLHDFDVSDDLSLNVSPDMSLDPFTNSTTVGVSLKLNINK